MELSVIVVSWNSRAWLGGCLDSLARHPFCGTCEIVVVDNASQDGSAALVHTTHPGARLIENPRNVGFAAGNNTGLRATSGRYRLLLNPDTVVQPGALDALVEYADAHPAAWAVGPRILEADGTLQRTGVRFPTEWNLFAEALFLDRLLPRTRMFGAHRELYADPGQARRVDYLQGSCLLIRAEALERVGRLDEDFFLYFEETDWCRRCRDAGGEVHYTPAASVTHHGGSGETRYSERKLLLYHDSLLRFCAKHHGPVRRLTLRAAVMFRAALRLAAWSVRALVGGPAGSTARSSARGYAEVLRRMLAPGAGRVSQ